MTRVAVLDDYQGQASGFADWASLGSDVQVTFFREPIAPGELVPVLSGFDVLVLMRERTRLPRPVIDALPDLRLLVTTGRRNAAFDVVHLNERGVVVCGTTGSVEGNRPGIPTTAEVAWALILALFKRVVVEDRAIRAGHWQLGTPATLAGATLGLAGLGNLGATMIGPARAFGMEVVAWSENLTDARAAEVGVRRVSRTELLSLSDVLSIHLLLSERTRGLFGADDLALMKPTAMLVNTSRGPIVDEQALLAALRDGTIAGAGFDVYDREPLPPGHPLTALDNVVLLPHLGYVSAEGFRTMYGQVVEDIAAWLAGSPVRVITSNDPGLVS